MQIRSRRKIAATFVFILAFIAGYPQHVEVMQIEPCDEGFVDVGEGEIYYQIFGEGLPILVVHGGPGLDQGYLQPQLLALAKDYKLIFYDQRGSGRSHNAPINERTINLDQFVRDIEVLRRSLGLKKFILMGHSAGGLLSMQYAIRHQKNLSGLILLNTSAAHFKRNKAYVEEFSARTRPIYNEVKPLFSYKEFRNLSAAEISDLYRKWFSVYFYNPQMVKDLSLKVSILSAQGGFWVREEMSKTPWDKPGIDIFPRLKELKVPTLVLHGKQDILPVWTAKEIHAAIPNSEIAILDECGHFSYIERSTEFFRAVRLFLNKLPSCSNRCP